MKPATNGLKFLLILIPIIISTHAFSEEDTIFCESLCQTEQCLFLYLIEDGDQLTKVCETDYKLVDEKKQYTFDIKSKKSFDHRQFVIKTSLESEDGKFLRRSSFQVKQGQNSILANLSAGETLITLFKEQYRHSEEFSKKHFHLNPKRLKKYFILKGLIDENEEKGLGLNHYLDENNDSVRDLLAEYAMKIYKDIEKLDPLEDGSFPITGENPDIDSFTKSILAQFDTDGDGINDGQDCKRLNNQKWKEEELFIRYKDLDCGITKMKVCYGEEIPDQYSSQQCEDKQIKKACSAFSWNLQTQKYDRNHYLHGEQEISKTYTRKIVNANEICPTKERKRICNDGKWGNWDEGFQYHRCIKITAPNITYLTGKREASGSLEKGNEFYLNFVSQTTHLSGRSYLKRSYRKGFSTTNESDTFYSVINLDDKREMVVKGLECKSPICLRYTQSIGQIGKYSLIITPKNETELTDTKVKYATYQIKAYETGQSAPFSTLSLGKDFQRVKYDSFFMNTGLTFDPYSKEYYMYFEDHDKTSLKTNQNIVNIPFNNGQLDYTKLSGRKKGFHNKGYDISTKIRRRYDNNPVILNNKLYLRKNLSNFSYLAAVDLTKPNPVYEDIFGSKEIYNAHLQGKAPGALDILKTLSGPTYLGQAGDYTYWMTGTYAKVYYGFIHAIHMKDKNIIHKKILSEEALSWWTSTLKNSFFVSENKAYICHPISHTLQEINHSGTITTLKSINSDICKYSKHFYPVKDKIYFGGRICKNGEISCKYPNNVNKLLVWNKKENSIKKVFDFNWDPQRSDTFSRIFAGPDSLFVQPAALGSINGTYEVK